MRQRVAERMQRALGQAHEAVSDRKDDARGAERNEARSRPGRADADSGGGVVAAAARDRNLARAEPPGGGDVRREMRRNLRTLDQGSAWLFP